MTTAKQRKREAKRLEETLKYSLVMKGREELFKRRVQEIFGGEWVESIPENNK